jgi:hypothetical protein
MQFCMLLLPLSYFHVPILNQSTLQPFELSILLVLGVGKDHTALVRLSILPPGESSERIRKKSEE